MIYVKHYQLSITYTHHKNDLARLMPLTDALVIFAYNPLHCFIASEDYWFFISYDIVYHCP